MTDDGNGEDDTDEEILGMYEQSPAGTGEGTSVELDSPVGHDDSEPERVTGTFYVKYAVDTSVTLHDVETAQICTLIENPGFDDHDIVEGTLVAQPPMEVSYLVEELDAHYTIPVGRSPEPPTRQIREVAEEMDEMDAVAIDREGEGEIHVLRVAPDDVERTAEELPDDEMTYKNAARYGVERVEIRTDEDGVVSIRYLP